MSERRTPVSHAEALEILSRYNASHFGNVTERARYSIPADPERDDDFALRKYIEQATAAEVSLREARTRLLAIAGIWNDWAHLDQSSETAKVAMCVIGEILGDPF